MDQMKTARKPRSDSMRKPIIVGVMVVLMLAAGYGWAQQRGFPGQKPGVPGSFPPGDQMEVFLELAGIPGESTDGAHKDNIDVLGFSFGASQPSVSGSTAGANAKTEFQPLKVIKKVDRASPRLFTACASGELIKKAVLVVRRGGRGNEFLKYILSDLVVSGIKQTLNQGGGVREEMDLSYGKVEIEYSTESPDGKGSGIVKGGWDLRANKRL